MLGCKSNSTTEFPKEYVCSEPTTTADELKWEQSNSKIKQNQIN